MRSIAELRTFILDEKVTHGRVIDFSKLPPAVVKKVAQGMVAKHMASSEDAAIDMLKNNAFSLTTDDAISSIIKRELEVYDERQDRMVLAANNITEAYNAMINAKFDEALKKIESFNAATKRFSDQGGDVSDRSEFNIVPLSDSVLSIASMYKEYIDRGVVEDAAEFRKHVMDQMFYPSDDPEKLKRYLQGRIKYNQTMVQMFQTMIKINYKLLGMSSEKAEMLVERLGSDDHGTKAGAIRELKNHIMNNRKQFEKRAGFIDFRSVGGGVVFMTDKYTGLGKFESPARLIQLAMQYDCIVFGHGDTSNAKKDADRDNKINDMAEQIRKLQSKQANIKRSMLKTFNYNSGNFDKPFDDSQFARVTERITLLKNKLKSLKEAYDYAYERGDTETVEKINTEIEKFNKKLLVANKQYQQILEELEKHSESENDEGKEKKYDPNAVTDIYIRLSKKNSELMIEENDMISKLRKLLTDNKPNTNWYGGVKAYWSIQPVRTEHGGPFTDMNDLLHQCIKEGYKKILVLSCNPGHHELSKDLQKRKDITIRHPTSTLLAESADIIEIHDPEPLMESTFDVNDPLDWALQECYMMEQDAIQIARSCNIDYYELDESVIIDLNEGIADRAKMAAKGVWKAIGILIAKTIKFVLYAIKKFKDFITGIIDRLKKFYEKRKGKFTEPVESNVIMVENASVITAKMNSWADLEKKAIESCEKMAVRIRAFNEDQLKCLKKMEEFADKKDRESNSTRANESFTISDLRSLIYT